MALVRRTFFLLLLLALIVLAAVFAANNPDPVSIDIGIARLEEVSVALAFTAIFAIGWAFGVLCAGAALLRMRAERRRLRRDLRTAQAELRGLRSLPIDDAD